MLSHLFIFMESLHFVGKKLVLKFLFSAQLVQTQS